MPHIPAPRRSASFSMPSVPKAPRRVKKIPKGTVPRISKPTGRRRSSMMSQDRLSVRKYQPSFEQLYEIMFGEKPNIDEHSGELTHGRPVVRTD